MSHFYAFWKRQQTFGFRTFSGGIKMKHWFEMSRVIVPRPWKSVLTGVNIVCVMVYKTFFDISKLFFQYKVTWEIMDLNVFIYWY